MKQVIIVRRQFRFDGGAERAVSTFIDVYRALGYRITLLCESWDGDSPHDFDIQRLALTGSRLKKLDSFRQQVMHYICSHSDHLVQSHEWIPSANLVRLGDGLHSVWLERLSANRNWLARTLLNRSGFHRQRVFDERETLLNPRLRKVIVNSEFVREQVCAQYPTISDRAIIVRNVVPHTFYDVACSETLSEFAPSSPRRLLFVGSGWERKGLDGAIEILAMLDENYSLTVIGQDKRAQKYRAFAKKAGVSSRVYFMGARQMTERDYKSFDGLLLPTLYDPFPNVVCEALVSGIPVFCSSQCGAVDFKMFEGVYICNSVAEYVQALKSKVLKPNASLFKTIFSHESAKAAIESVL